MVRVSSNPHLRSAKYPSPQKLLSQGGFGETGDLVFVHTGGAAALFAMDLPRA